jgi:hypothetical protein
MRIEVKAGPEFDAAARRLYAAGRGELEREYRKGILKAVRPAGALVKASTPQYLPNSGGYSAVIAAALQVRSAQEGPGVTITARAGRRQIENLEGGGLKAPSYPRGRRARWKWHHQKVRPNFFTEPIDTLKPQIRQGLVDAMQTVADKIVEG